MADPKHSFQRGDEKELADTLILDLEKDGQLGVFGGRVFKYFNDTGTWQPLAPPFLEALVAEYAGSPIITPKMHLLKVSHRIAKGAVGLAASMLHRRGALEFPTASLGVAFQNGFLSIEDGFKMLPHSPQHLARFAHPFDYDSQAQAPEFHKALAQYFASVTPSDALERISLLQEFMGAALFGCATTHQVCLVLLGTGANGKTTFMDLVAPAFPPGSVCAVPPQQFGDRFRTAELDGALLNLVNELPSGEIVSTSGFKSVISGDLMTAERKYENPYLFRPRAGHVFLANGLPPFDDRSEGFARRLRVVPFEEDLRQLPGYRPGFADDIVRGELPGIINWLILGAMRAQQRGLISSAVSNARVAEWGRDNDPVQLFITELYERDPSGRVSASALLGRFLEWAKSNGYRGVNRTTFGRRMRALGVPAAHTRSGNTYPLRPRSV